MNKIYYISQGKNPENHIFNIKVVLEAGCKLIQLRLKNVDDTVYLDSAIKVKQMCVKYGAKLIINDNVFVFMNSGADGIHLGKKDACPLEIRKKASHKIIGATANTYNDCVALINKKVDYIGLGPYHFTKTKNNLSPILGKEKIEEIVLQLKDELNFSAIYLIGGITSADFLAISDLNISGVAISGSLTNLSTKIIEQRINKFEQLKK